MGKEKERKQFIFRFENIPPGTKRESYGDHRVMYEILIYDETRIHAQVRAHAHDEFNNENCTSHYEVVQ